MMTTQPGTVAASDELKAAIVSPATLLYYADPDQNQLEFLVENFDSVEESVKFFCSEALREDLIGFEIDPADLLRRLRAGEPEVELERRPNDGARNLSDVKLR
jgi:hypothetical protein